MTGPYFKRESLEGGYTRWTVVLPREAGPTLEVHGLEAQRRATHFVLGAAVGSLIGLRCSDEAEKLVAVMRRHFPELMG